MQLEIVDDLADDLEEFSRLQRLGDFAGANRYVTQNMNDEGQNPYVHVQYAHLLYDSGDYKRLRSLPYLESLPSQLNPRHGALRREWELLKDAAEMHAKSPPTRKEYESACFSYWQWYEQAQDKISSTEVSLPTTEPRNFSNDPSFKR